MNKCGNVMKESQVNTLVRVAKSYSASQKRSMRLYNDNATMGAIFTLGQKSNAGTMVLAQTVNTGFVHGKVWQAFQSLDGEHQP